MYVPMHVYTYRRKGKENIMLLSNIRSGKNVLAHKHKIIHGPIMCYSLEYKYTQKGWISLVEIFNKARKRENYIEFSGLKHFCINKE
jgi:hypothetical protein